MTVCERNTGAEKEKKKKKNSDASEGQKKKKTMNDVQMEQAR